MTKQEKIEWTKNAGNEELLNQWFEFRSHNDYGVNNEDIEITLDEILKRMKFGKG